MMCAQSLSFFPLVFFFSFFFWRNCVRKWICSLRQSFSFFLSFDFHDGKSLLREQHKIFRAVSFYLCVAPGFSPFVHRVGLMLHSIWRANSSLCIAPWTESVRIVFDNNKRHTRSVLREREMLHLLYATQRMYEYFIIGEGAKEPGERSLT